MEAPGDCKFSQSELSVQPQLAQAVALTELKPTSASKQNATTQIWHKAPANFFMGTAPLSPAFFRVKEKKGPHCLTRYFPEISAGQSKGKQFFKALNGSTRRGGRPGIMLSEGFLFLPA